MSDPTATPDADLDPAALRGKAIAALHDIIYAAPPEPEPADKPIPPEHDPDLRPRTEAVELLGRFPDDEAARELGKLLLRGERDIPAPAGRWLRDTALLTLLRSAQLPAKEVDRALGRAYSFLRHPWPWQWSSVYDELPLLARYHKLGVFFRAFWLWPLLIFAVPTLFFIKQLLFPTPGEIPPFWISIPALLGCGLEIYLAHQVIIALLAGLQGPLLRVKGEMTSQQKGWLGAGLGLITLGMILFVMVAIVGGSSQLRGSAGVIGLRLTALIVPLLLLPMFMLAHDLEQVVRRAPKGREVRLQLWTTILRRTTDILYLMLLPLLAASVWSDPENVLPAAALGFLAYLFAVPLFVTGGLRWLSGALDRGGGAATSKPPSA